MLNIFVSFRARHFSHHTVSQHYWEPSWLTKRRVRWQRNRKETMPICIYRPLHSPLTPKKTSLLVNDLLSSLFKRYLKTPIFHQTLTYQITFFNSNQNNPFSKPSKKFIFSITNSILFSSGTNYWNLQTNSDLQSKSRRYLHASEFFTPHPDRGAQHVEKHQVQNEPPQRTDHRQLQKHRSWNCHSKTSAQNLNLPNPTKVTTASAKTSTDNGGPVTIADSAATYSTAIRHSALCDSGALRPAASPSLRVRLSRLWQKLLQIFSSEGSSQNSYWRTSFPLSVPGLRSKIFTFRRTFET